jgi:sterol desaturase/sphingolipid hydroxylase (fatty acid hydroxylase superfamily)
VLVLFFFVAAIGFAFLESRRGAYRNAKEWRNELQVSVMLGAAAVILQMTIWRGPAAAGQAGVTLALLVAIFVLDDLLYYVSHRMAHRVGFFWASHSVHHSPIRFDFFTGLRQPPSWMFTPAAAAPLLLVWGGAPIELVAMSGSARALHHYLLHTERIRRLPRWVEWTFNTPSHHRVHHSSDHEHLDKNFGAVLILWDRIFGTFVEEPAVGVSRYGVLYPPVATNVLGVVIHPWRRLLGRMAEVRAFVDKVAMLFAPPFAVQEKRLGRPRIDP